MASSRNLLFCLLLLCCCHCHAQNLDSALDLYAEHFNYRGEIYTLRTDTSGINDPGSLTHKNNGRLHSWYIKLNRDSTFIFNSFYEVGHDYSIGRWYQVGDTLIMNWNKTETLEACGFKKSSSQAHHYNFLFPVPVSSWRFLKTDHSLTPIQ